MNMSAQFPPILVWLATVSTASVVLAAGLTWLARRRSAAWRHFFWMLALAAPLLAGMMAVLPLRFSLPLLPPETVATSTAQPPSLPLTEFSPAPPSRSVAPTTSNLPAAHPAKPLPTISLWIAIWVCGMCGVVTFLVWSRLRLASALRGDALRPSKTLQRRLDTLQRSTGYWLDVEVSVSSVAAVPFCFGSIRPAIVFPEAWEEWPEERLEVALRHEFAHIQRHDLSTLALARWSCAICWFNPLVWWAATRLRDEAEQAADDLVLAGPAPASRYATHLLAMAEDCQAAALPRTFSLSMTQPNRLANRIRAILDTGVRRERPAAGNMVIISLLAIVALAAGMTVRLTAAPQELPTGPSLAEIKPEDRSMIWDQIYDEIRAGNVKAIEALLARDLDPNTKLRETSPMLYVAVDRNQEKIVELLLAKGADVNGKTSWGDLPFRRACWRGNKAIADRLVAAGATKEDLVYATGMGDTATLESLDKVKPIAEKDAKNLINCAVTAGRTNSFDWLWEKLGIRDEAEKKKLLAGYFAKAAEWRQPGMIKHLEKHGVSIKEDGAAALAKAVDGNSPETVEYLLKAGAPLPTDRNLLRDAAGDGQISIARALLDHGADIDRQDDSGFTSLMWAAYNYQPDVCLLLLARGANPHIKNKYGENAAWIAAGGAHCPEALEAMIKMGVDVKGTKPTGQSILHSMMHYVPPRPGKVAFPGKVYSEAEIRKYYARERRTIDLLVAAGVDVNRRAEQFDSATPLMTALDTGHHEAARALLDHGADAKALNKHGRSALDSAFNQAPLPVDVFERIIKALGEPNPTTAIYTPSGRKPVPILGQAISYAANTNYEAAPIREAVKILLANGATFPGVKDDDSQRLLQAAARGDLQGIQAAIANGASIDATETSGWTALSISVSLGYDACTDWLLQSGAEVEAKGGRSAVDLAIQSARPDIVEKLLTKGAKFTSLDQSLFYAAEQNNERLVNILIGLGANPSSTGGTSVQGPDGKVRRITESFPLYYCVRNGNPRMVKTFLDRGADPDPEDLSSGNSFLLMAVDDNQPEIVKLLIEYGANPETTNSMGQSPLEYARKLRKDLVPVIEEARKNVRPKAST